MFRETYGDREEEQYRTTVVEKRVPMKKNCIFVYSTHIKKTNNRYQSCMERNTKIAER